MIEYNSSHAAECIRALSLASFLVADQEILWGGFVTRALRRNGFPAPAPNVFLPLAIIVHDPTFAESLFADLKSLVFLAAGAVHCRQR
ncbi:MAG: hypothetical protein ACD_44C00450G0001 [uncultured bacterium]|nr:MAG: hypothetical protein ACD_44C00450G0001 [uncultured bacterium]